MATAAARRTGPRPPSGRAAGRAWVAVRWRPLPSRSSWSRMDLLAWGVTGPGRVAPARWVLLLADDRRQFRLEVLQGLIGRLGAGQGRVCLLLDRGGGVAVLDDRRPADRAVHRRLQHRQVSELLDQLRIVVERRVYRRLGGLLQVRLLLGLAGQELDELERTALVLGELADREVVPAEGGLAGAGEPGNCGHA